MTLILLTNDDGIEAEGLRALENSVAGLGEAVVVAPDRERSAVSHSLTIRTPLESQEVQPNHYTVNGTPADCVIFALTRILSRRPDLVISGINHGANLGDDIMYSGTVAAAREASKHGIAAIAVSQAYDTRPIRFDAARKFVRKLVQTLQEQGSDGFFCLNVNIPVRRVRGVRITRQGGSVHFPHFNSLDPKGPEPESEPVASGHGPVTGLPADFEAIIDRYVSITPLRRDQTDYPAVQALQKDFTRLLAQPPFLRWG